MRIVFHPLFLLVIVIAIWMGLGMFMLMAILAVLIHESAHAIVAGRYGVRATKITLLPFGGEVSIDCAFLPRGAQVKILIAGSLANMIACVVAISFSWLLPFAFGLLGLFIVANVSVAIVNMLPFYPLDMGKIIALGDNEKITKALFFVSNLVFSMLFVAAIFIQSLVLALFAACMLISVNTETKDKYVSKLCKVLSVKQGPVREVAIQSSMTLLELLRQVNHRKYTKFIITDKRNIVLYETSLEKLLTEHKLDTRLLDIID